MGRGAAEQKAPVSLTWESEESADSQALGLAAVDLPERREPQKGTLGSLADPKCAQSGAGRVPGGGQQLESRVLSRVLWLSMAGGQL